MKIWKKLVCGALAASMLLAAGCSSEDTSWSYRMGDTQLPIGTYIYYMIEVASVAQDTLDEEHAGEEGYSAPDSYKKLLDETVDGKPVAEYISEGAEKRSREFFAIEREFEARGLALGESELAYASSTAEGTIAQDPALYEENGVAESSLRLILENDAKRQMIFDDIYGEGGEKAVSEQALKDYYAENYALADMMAFYKTAAEGEAEDAGRKSAEDFLQKLKDGTAFYDAVYEANKAEAEQQGQDPESVERPAEDSQTGVFTDSMRGSYGDALIDGVFAAKVGEPALIEDATMYFVVNRRDILEDGDDFQSLRENLLVTMKSEEFIAQVEAWAEDVAPEPNTAAVQKYRPEKLKVS